MSKNMMPMCNQNYEIINYKSQAPLILLVEHAGGDIPEQLNNLGLPATQFKEDPQMFYDPGARDMALTIGKTLGLPIYLGKLSRLVVDLNRESTHIDVIKSRFHGRDIPGNKDLSEKDRLKRLEDYYFPFHTALKTELERRQEYSIPTKLISIHSFNEDVAFQTFPTLKRSEVDIAMLYDENSHLVQNFRKAIQPNNYMFKENYPYDLSSMKTGSILENGRAFALDVLGIEVNAKFSENSKDFNEITQILLHAIKSQL